MKLYLSSYKLGNKVDFLQDWLKDHDNKIGLIINARDIFPEGERKENRIKSDAKELENLGFDVKIVDLKNYFGKKEELEELLTTIPSFYVIGGNVFTLRRAMKLSGFDEVLRKHREDGEFLYIGSSSGICVLCKDLQAITVMDDPDIDPYNSNISAIYEGIGFIEETIIPHFESNHKETVLASKAVEYCRQNNLTYQTLHDGEVIIKDLVHDNKKVK